MRLPLLPRPGATDSSPHTLVQVRAQPRRRLRRSHLSECERIRRRAAQRPAQAQSSAAAGPKRSARRACRPTRRQRSLRVAGRVRFGCWLVAGHTHAHRSCGRTASGFSGGFTGYGGKRGTSRGGGVAHQDSSGTLLSFSVAAALTIRDAATAKRKLMRREACGCRPTLLLSLPLSLARANAASSAGRESACSPQSQFIGECRSGSGQRRRVVAGGLCQASGMPRSPLCPQSSKHPLRCPTRVCLAAAPLRHWRAGRRRLSRAKGASRGLHSVAPAEVAQCGSNRSAFRQNSESSCHCLRCCINTA